MSDPERPVNPALLALGERLVQAVWQAIEHQEPAVQERLRAGIRDGQIELDRPDPRLIVVKIAGEELLEVNLYKPLPDPKLN
jgi:hypothetical protein